MNKKRRLLLSYYFLFSLFFLIFSLFKPIYHWDMIAYAASAMSFIEDDPIELHRFVYDELKVFIPEDDYDELTSGYYRSEVSKVPEALQQQISFYQIKVLFNVLILSLSSMGVNIYLSAYIISAVATVAGLGVVAFTFRPFVDDLFMYILPFWGLATGLSEISRISTPDALVFLVVALSVLFLIKNVSALPWMLLFCVFVRTDLIIFSVTFLLYLLYVSSQNVGAHPCSRLTRQGRALPLPKIIEKILIYGKKYEMIRLFIILVACITAYFSIGIYYNRCGWYNLFYFSFIEFTPYPKDLSISFTISDYIHILVTSIRRTLENKAFLVFLSFFLPSFYILSEKIKNLLALQKEMMKPSFSENGGKHLESLKKSYHKLLFILVSSISYVGIHFVFFPSNDERFFIGQYLLTTAVFFSLIAPSDFSKDEVSFSKKRGGFQSVSVKSKT